MSTQNIDWNTPYNNERDYAWLPTARLTHILDHVNTTNAETVLDVGCGTGQLCRDLVHRGFRVRGVDMSSTAIAQAKKSTTLPINSIEFAVCDVEKDDIATGKYDIVFCKYMLAFVSDKNKFLKKIAALKTPDGTFVVISPDITQLPEPKKDIALDHQSTVNLLAKHFTQVSFEAIGSDYCYYAK